MRKFLLSVVLLYAALIGFAQNNGEKRYAMYGVGFYNLENLFDTLHDAGKNDFEYLPDGANAWSGMKYRAKLKNMSTVLGEMCTDKLKNGPAFIGLSEVENRSVVEDLLKQPALAGRNYRVVHIEGPDRRGVDCAAIYNPKYFELDTCMLVYYYYLDPNQPEVDLSFYVDENKRVVPYQELRGDTSHVTRGFLVVSGKLVGEKTHFIVNHWPSRFAGSEARERAGYQVYHLKEALLEQDPGAHTIIMGDMHDDPKNKSMSEQLKCKHDIKEVKSAHDLYNPWWDMLYKKGQGTLSYQGSWNLFDQIVFSGDLIGDDRSTLKFLRNEVFLREYLFQREGRYKGSPFRTHAGGVWLNGYSDHLPTYIYLVKEVK